MPLFACRQCEAVENTACSGYWSQWLDGKPVLCSECNPEIGKWHGKFPKRPSAGMLVDQNGQLWSTAESMPKHYEILGQVLTTKGSTHG